MLSAPLPANETERQRALDRLEHGGHNRSEIIPSSH